MMKGLFLWSSGLWGLGFAMMNPAFPDEGPLSFSVLWSRPDAALNLEEAFAGTTGLTRFCFPVWGNSRMALAATIPTGSDRIDRPAAEQLRQFNREARARGAEVYAAFDCLHWVLPGTPPEADPFRDHPDWQELNSPYVCREATDGKYASPFLPEVRVFLGQMVEEVAQALPDLAGIVLDCHLSLQGYLSCSVGARQALIQAHQMDPWDIVLNPYDDTSRQALRTLERWRLDEVTRLVGELSAAFRRHHPQGKVMGRGFANLYRWKGGGKNWLAQDWLNWVLEGHIEELLLECDWTAPENEASLALAGGLVQRTGVPVAVLPLLYAPSRPGSASYEAQLAALQKQTRLDHVMLEVATAEDWEMAQGFLSQKHPIVEPSPPTTEVPLEDDRRLQTLLECAEQGTPLPQILEKLSASLGVPLRAAGAVREKVISLTAPAQPAAKLLKQIAGMVQGLWREEGAGFVLGEQADPDRLQGDWLRAHAQYGDAINAYERALARRANELEAHLGEAQCYWHLGDYPSAIAHYEEALEQDPEHPEAYIGLGSAHRALGQYEKAIAHFQELLQRRPDSVWGWVELGLAQAALGQRETALQTLQEAIRIAPEMWQPRFYLAQTHLEMGHFEESRQVLQEALQLPLEEPARKQLQELLERGEGRPDR